ncbi:hypothetical protein ITJ66_16660 [Plantibacter sp. VKM Ac-2885]|uniref:hypothetical protein n=1 Tax=Plantibacter sp. VKM Ac-2885 TaxID=2783828 RepID=UPI00188CB34F|nr:hypothetical protein [Plantibacter sp. VKM Ac-2885]MBF4514119.1 hypothetical protein [Plantibacter sp. VKM Ac-2885]
MSAELVVAVLGIIIATALTIYVYRRTNPKRVIRYRVEITPLLGQNPVSSQLTVTLGPQAVANPHIVAITVWSSGRADISSQSFDGGVPMVFELGALIIEVNPASTPQDPPIVVRAQTQLELRPSLLRKGFQSHLQVVVDGAPTIGVTHALIDIPVIADAVGETGRVIQTSRRPFRISTLNIGLAALVVALVLLTIGLVVNISDKAAGQAWGSPAILLGLLAFPTILIGGIIRIVKWRTGRS